MDIISYTLLESVVRPAIQLETLVSYEEGPGGKWMTEDGYY